jgi:glycosyltransferase involved in cell wall biosynthesis
MPVRNEADHIAATLDAVLAQTFDQSRMEIVIVDGCSTDGTREILDRFRTRFPGIRIVDNPRGTTPTSLNRGIAATRADIIVRVDGHCRLAPDYVERCVAHLAASGAANVGGLMRPQGTTIAGRAIAAALRSRVGIGNAHFHYLERQEWADTVYLGAFRREVLVELGGYDEELVRNQDDELNYRIRAAGYGILLCPDIRSTYVPRSSLRAVWRQFYQYGYWKVRVFQKHPASIQPRQLAPLFFTVYVAFAVLSLLVGRRRIALAPMACYGAVTATAAVRAPIPARSRLMMPLVLACMHFGYGVGNLHGLLDALRSGLDRSSDRATLQR